MKKIRLAILLTLCFMPSVAFAQSVSPETKIINNNKVELTPEEYNKLIDMGYTDSQIMFFDQEIVDRNLNKNSELVSQSVSYLKTIYKDDSYRGISINSKKPSFHTEEIELTKEQYELETSKASITDYDGSHDSAYYGYRTLTTSLFKEGTYANPEYRVTSVVQWDYDYAPKTRSFDILGITFSHASDITVKEGSQYALQTYTTTYKSTGKSEFGNVKYSDNSDHYTKNNNGYAISMNLLDDTSTYTISEMNSYLEYTVIKRGSNTVNNLQFGSTYVHAQKNVDLLDVVGFLMDPSASGLAMFLLSNPVSQKYDSGNQTLVQMIGINW